MIFALIAFVVIAAIGAAATAAITHDSGKDPRIVLESDAAMPGSEVIGGLAADPTGGPPWSARTYRNGRHEKCVDVGQVVHGRLSDQTPTGFVESIAGQHGACAPAGQMLNLSSRYVNNADGSTVKIVFGTVGASVESISIAGDNSAGSTPTGPARLVVTAATVKTSYGESVSEASENTGDAIVNFSDGSKLELDNPLHHAPPRGSLADRAWRELRRQ